MNPDTTPIERRPGRPLKATRRTRRSMAGATPLQALSAASDRYTRSIAGSRPPYRRPSIVLASIAALAVAGALTFAGRFEYCCQATLRAAGSVTADRFAVHRRELLDYAWDRTSDAPGLPGASQRWFVDSPESGMLRFCLTTTDRQAGVERVREIALGFRAKMLDAARTARATPTPAEDVLSRYASRLQARLTETQEQVDAAILALPDTDPSEHRTAFLVRWRALRSDFDAARRQLAEASEHTEQLRAEPMPAHGLVEAERRKAALEADAALQQDLRELSVNLSELKAHLLDVWQQSGGSLEQLILSAEEFGEFVSESRHSEGLPDDSARPETPVILVGPYVELIEEFAGAWNREFVSLQRLDIDPYSGEVLDVYHRVRRLLNDFLFAAAKRLASMRSEVRAVSEDSTDSARHHVFQSNLIRAFETMQAAHHRFEFSAGTLETPDNFQLDVALRAARGLRRRSQERVGRIEEELQAKAAKRAHDRRMQELTEAEALVEQVRTATDETVDELIALQEELNLSAEMSEAFLRAVLKAEIATAKLKLTQDDLSTTKDRLHELEVQRTAGTPESPVEFISAGVIGRPVNLPERLRAGAVGGGLTFLLVLLAQWWITRRN